MASASGRGIGPIGALTRITFGAGLALWGLFAEGSFLRIPARSVVFLTAGVGALVLVQLVMRAVDAPPLRATGALGHVVSIVIYIALVTIEPTRQAALLFYGASLVVAGARGYAGCEVTALTNWLLRRDDQVGCVVLGPIDALERSVSVRS